MPMLDVITVVTTDLERSLAFYRLLGVGPPDLVSPRFATADLGHRIRLAWTVEPEQLCSKSKNTPFDGARLEGRALVTFVAGRPVYHYG